MRTSWWSSTRLYDASPESLECFRKPIIQQQQLMHRSCAALRRIRRMCSIGSLVAHAARADRTFRGAIRAPLASGLCATGPMRRQFWRALRRFKWWQPKSRLRVRACFTSHPPHRSCVRRRQSAQSRPLDDAERSRGFTRNSAPYSLYYIGIQMLTPWAPNWNYFKFKNGFVFFWLCFLYRLELKHTVHIIVNV